MYTFGIDIPIHLVFTTITILHLIIIYQLWRLR